MKQKGQQSVFSWKQLTAVLAVCAATLYFLLPDDPTLLESLIDDGKTDEAQRQLDRVTEAQYEADPLRYEVAQQRIDRLGVISNESAEAWTEYVLAAIKRWQANTHAPELMAFWADDFGRLDALEPVWSALRREWNLVPASSQSRLVDRLMQWALSNERPDLAADIAAATFGESPAEQDRALELAGLYRMQGDAGRALEALTRVKSPEVDALRLGLLRELNKNAAALDQLLASGSAGTEWTPSELELLVQVARGAAQPERAIPVLMQYLSQDPDDLAGWRLLVTLQRENGLAKEAAESQARVVALSQRSSDELKEWARLLEGAGQPGRAFDVYVELSEMGYIPALARMIALNPGLFRDRDIAEVLEDLIPVNGNDGYTLLYAQILAKLGRYDASIAAYQLYLESRPRDREALLELGTLAVEIYDYPLAVEILERSKALSEGNVDAIRRLGDAWMKLGEYEKALVEYRLAAELSGLPNDYGNYFRLARGLGDYDGFVAGLAGVVASEQATPSDYMTLAYGYQLLDQNAEAERVMREGMQRFPDNPDIPLRLGYVYGDTKRFREAQEIMAQHPLLGSAIEPTRFYLLLMRLNNDLVAEQQFLARELSPAVLGDGESQRLLAGAYAATGRWAEAEVLLRSLYAAQPSDWEVVAALVRVLQQQQKPQEAAEILQPLLGSEEPDALRLAADLFSNLGRYREAERYQTRYLAVADPIVPADWGALGDIRSSRGDFEGAKRAYRKAVQVFQERLVANDKPQLR